MSFQPQYLKESEFVKYGLPTPQQQKDIVTLVQAASTLIDEYCGRQDNDGNGSLMYSTYEEILNMPSDRNVVRLSFRPLVALSEATRVAIEELGENYYTGFKSNTIIKGQTQLLSPILTAVGWYGYGRRGESRRYADSPFGSNIMNIASNFGGPPSWVDVSINLMESDGRTGEIWVPAGLYLSNYTELKVTYNAGFDPRDVPRGLRHATAALVKNLLARGSGTTGLKGLSGAGKIHTEFTEQLIDPTLDELLNPYKVVISG